MKADDLAATVASQGVKIESLQAQIVELRMRLEQQGATSAALLDHAVANAVAAEMGGRQFTDIEHGWVRSAAADAAERKRVRSALVLHVLQWFVGGAVGFMLFSAWESVKASLGSKQ